MPEKKPGISIFQADMLMLVSMIIFGSYALFLRFFPQIPAISFLFFFQAAGLVIFALIAERGFTKITRKEFVLFGILALVTLGNDLTYFLAFRLTSVANAAISHQMASVFLLFLAPVFLKEKTSRSEWISFWLSLVGIGILYSDGLSIGRTNDLWGVTLGLLSAVFYAFLIILYRRLLDAGLTVRKINFWRFAISAPLLLPIMLSFGGFKIGTGDLLPLVIFGILFAVVASGMHNFALGRSRALHASIIGKSEPVIASLYALFFLDEMLSLRTVLGGILIVGSSVWLATRKDGNG